MTSDAVNSHHRVVITGAGMVTPLGHNVADTWQAILQSKAGIGPFTLFPHGQHTIQGLCEVKEFDPVAYLGRKEARRRDRYQQFAAVAAHEALHQSGLPITDDNRERIGVSLGTGVGGVRTMVEQEHVTVDKGPGRVSPFCITMIMPNGAAGIIAIDYGIQGPSTTITTACAASNDAIGHAFRLVRSGELLAVVAGGAESIMTPMCLAGFEQAGATSSKATDAPQPFDKNRDGLVAGEGAGILVLESAEHAVARGATILAEIVGYGQTTDAYHITAPAEGGLGAARAIRKALKDARLQPIDIQYISAHGTATQLNDLAETQAIKNALGEHAYNVGISSTKSMTGHIMGATGSIETIFCALAIRDQIMPATAHYQTVDPNCDLDYVPNVARPAKINACLNNAFGFGGHNSVLVIKKFV